MRYRRCWTTDKVQFKKRKHARRIVRKLDDAYLMDIYRCIYCGDWHIGHRRGSRRLRAMAEENRLLELEWNAWFAEIWEGQTC